MAEVQERKNKSCMCTWYSESDDTMLIGIISTHIDDLKGAGIVEWQEPFDLSLVEVFGKITKDAGKFEHCGILILQC